YNGPDGADFAFVAGLLERDLVAAKVTRLHLRDDFAAGIDDGDHGAAERPSVFIGDYALDLAFRRGAFVGTVVAGAAQRTSANVAGELAAFEREHAVDEHVLNALRGAVRVLERRDIDDVLGIEDGDVGKVILLEHAAVAQLHALRRERRHL